MIAKQWFNLFHSPACIKSLLQSFAWWNLINLIHEFKISCFFIFSMILYVIQLKQVRRFVVIEGGDGVAYRCVTQPNSAGGLGGAVSPQGPGQSPGSKRILATIY